MDTSPLISFLEKIHPLSPGIKHFLSLNIGFLYVKKGEFIDQYPRADLLFVTSGLLAGHMCIGDQQITCWIVQQNEMTLPSQPLSLNYGAEKIEAFENTTALTISADVLEQLGTAYPSCRMLETKILASCIDRVNQDSIFLKRYSDKSKLLKYQASRPGLIERVPMKYLASYLNIEENKIEEMLENKTAHLDDH